jgi:hypothetical protein
VKIQAKICQFAWKGLTTYRFSGTLPVLHRFSGKPQEIYMQLEIQGLHEQAMLRLMQHENEKTAAAMVRILIRDAAKEAGVWPSHGNDEGVSQPIESAPQASR